MNYKQTYRPNRSQIYLKVSQLRQFIRSAISGISDISFLKMKKSDGAKLYRGTAYLLHQNCIFNKTRHRAKVFYKHNCFQYYD